MPSFQTLFRAVVMVVIGVVGFKAWKLYGPTNEQVKSTAAHVVELVQSAIQSRQPAPNAAADPRVAAPQLTPSQGSAVAAPPMSPSAPLQGEAPKLLVQGGVAPVVNGPPAEAGSPGAGAGDRVSELMARLQQLGAADTKLAPWGSDGSLYRFSCRAPLPSAPTMTKHFESVAAEPAAAVEQVLAKVEAWKVAQRDGGTLRY
jgi:hypothetical protein